MFCGVNITNTASSAAIQIPPDASHMLCGLQCDRRT
jgi:hypothetical protein